MPSKITRDEFTQIGLCSCSEQRVNCKNNMSKKKPSHFDGRETVFSVKLNSTKHHHNGNYSGLYRTVNYQSLMLKNTMQETRHVKHLSNGTQ